MALLAVSVMSLLAVVVLASHAAGLTLAHWLLGRTKLLSKLQLSI